MRETRQHETVISLPVSPEEVWRGLTEAGYVEMWYAPAARIDAKAGGEYFVSWGPGMDAPGIIEAYEPGRHLRVACERPAGAEGPVRIAIDFFLESDGGSTILRLVHSGFGTTGNWDNEYNGTKMGWPIMLRILGYALRTKRAAGKQRWVYSATPMPLAEAWARFRDWFPGVSAEYEQAPSEFCAPWSEMGDGLVYGAFGERKGVTGISLHVVLFNAASRVDEAAAFWQNKLAQLGTVAAPAPC